MSLEKLEEILNIIKAWFTNNADWLQAVEAIVVIVGLPVVFFRWLFALPYKPRVKLYFDPKETYYQLPAVDLGKDSFWLHLMVKNKSPFADIKNTQGFISSVWEIRNNKKGILPLFRSQIKLHWAHEIDNKPKDIIGGRKRRLDICYALEGDKTLYLATTLYPSGTQRVLPPGEYIFLVNLTAENLSHSVNYLLRVSWNGKYTELRATTYKRNIIELIFGLTKEVLNK